MVERLWFATNDEKWRFEHFGPSTLGDAIGWARPEEYSISFDAGRNFGIGDWMSQQRLFSAMIRDAREKLKLLLAS